MNQSRFQSGGVAGAAWILLALLTGCGGRDGTLRVDSGDSLTGRVEGRLVAPGRSSLPATLISLGSTLTPSSVVHTDALGRFDFSGLAPGDYEVSYLPPAGFAAAEGEVARSVSVTQGDVIKVNFLLATSDTTWIPPGEVGLIRFHARADGAPVPDVLLYSFGEDGGAQARGVTDANGNGEMWAPVGHCALRVEPPNGYGFLRVQPEDLIVSEESTAEVQIDLFATPPPTTGDLFIQVVGSGTAADSLGLEQVPVRIKLSGTGELVASGETGERGLVTWSLPAGTYDAEIDVPVGYHLMDRQSNPAREVELSLGETRWVAFYVSRD
ncbi:MAG: carboxypeptidase-like regulatory domain-containing protein [Candidatus Eisenbacteria bacterium]